jgi:hypothetical protein
MDLRAKGLLLDSRQGHNLILDRSHYPTLRE